MTAASVPVDPVASPAGSAGLHRPGQLLVAAIVAAGIAVGAQSLIGLFWFIPFAGVGAVVAIRRPSTSIGWQLLALAWCFALGTVTIDASARQFIEGTVPWTVALLAVAAFVSQPVLLLLLSVLALTFPSGRLPAGRWARPTRVALGIGLTLVVLAMLAPTIHVTLRTSTTFDVPNPIAVAPSLAAWQVLGEGRGSLAFFALLLGSIVSLAIRFRRAEGIERQQMRWFGASLVLVAALMLTFLAIVTLSELSVLSDSMDTKFLVYLAIPAFASVPVAIGIAVLRYRLYEIDTIINRAVVYGMLTAILAGISAATIGVGQRVFQGVAGPGSEATVVVATLLVVTIFTPIKNRLQALVDRHFKETRDPAAELEAFVAEVRRSFGPPFLGRTLRPLLEVAIIAYSASGGEVRFRGHAAPSAAVGEWAAEPSALVSAPADGTVVELRLFGSDPTRDLGPLRLALGAVIAETAGTGAP